MDDADMSDVLIAADLQASRTYSSHQVAMMPDGIEGECDLCGEYSPRLVEYYGSHNCAPCRDKHHLP